MPNLHTPDQFKSRPALIGMALLGLVLAYALGSRAIDTGSWWEYLGTFLLLTISIRLAIHGVKAKK